MQELQDDTIAHFIGKDVSYSNLDDLKAMIRVFFERASHQSPVQEKIFTSGSYRFVYESINKRIMEHRRETNKGAFGLDEASESIVFAYYGNITALLYRQWVEDGRKLSLDEIVELAQKLICEGMGSVVKKDSVLENRSCGDRGFFILSF